MVYDKWNSILGNATVVKDETTAKLYIVLKQSNETIDSVFICITGVGKLESDTLEVKFN